MALLLAALLGLSGLGTVAVLLMNPGNTPSETAPEETPGNSPDAGSEPAPDTAYDAAYPCEVPTDLVSEPVFQREEAPDPAEAEDRGWTGTITTNCGDVEITREGAAGAPAVA